MTLTIEISQELEACLKHVASERCLDEHAYVRRLIEYDLTAHPNGLDYATLTLLAKWKAEGDAATPEEIALAEQEWEEFRKGMNENSTRGYPVYP